MNVDRILAVADAIEQHTIPWLGFNMGPMVARAIDAPAGLDEMTVDHSGHECGTVACIAGWTMILLENKLTEEDSKVPFEEFTFPYGAANAREVLDLTHLQADYLFFGRGANVSYRAEISSAQAVRTLRHLAATGQVDWTV